MGEARKPKWQQGDCIVRTNVPILCMAINDLHTNGGVSAVQSHTARDMQLQYGSDGDNLRGKGISPLAVPLCDRQRRCVFCANIHGMQAHSTIQIVPAG